MSSTNGTDTQRYFLLRRAGDEDLPTGSDLCSAGWSGYGMRPCQGCTECDGFGWVPGEPHPDPQPGVDVPEELTCEGMRVIEDLRDGVSAATTLEGVATWLAHSRRYDEESGFRDDDDLIVLEVEGRPSGAEAHDADAGEVLILPDRVIGAQPLPEEVRQRASQIQRRLRDDSEYYVY